MSNESFALWTLHNRSIADHGNINSTGTLQDKRLWYALTTSISMFATLTNLALVLAVYKDRTSHCATRILVGNVALTGLLLSGIGYLGVNTSVFLTSLGYSIGPPCKFFPFFHLCLAASAWADVSLAVNRVVAICFPLRYTQWRTSKVSLGLVLAAWLISVIVILVPLTGSGMIYAPLPDGGCITRPLNVFGRFWTYMWVIVPYCIVGVLSLAIVRTAYRCLHPGGIPRGPILPVSRLVDLNRHRHTMKKRLIVAKAMVASLLWCLVFTLPLTILNSSFPALFVKYPSLASWLRLLPLIQYAGNPMMFFAVSSVYKAALGLRMVSLAKSGTRRVGSKSGNTAEASGSLGGTNPRNTQGDENNTAS